MSHQYADGVAGTNQGASALHRNLKEASASASASASAVMAAYQAVHHD